MRSDRRRPDRPRLGDGVRARRVARAAARQRSRRSSTPRARLIAASLAEQQAYGLVDDAARGDRAHRRLPGLETRVAGRRLGAGEPARAGRGQARRLRAPRSRGAAPTRCSRARRRRFPRRSSPRPRRTRALPRRASGQSAASRAGGRAVRRAVDRAGDARARARGDDRGRPGADHRASASSTASSSIACRARCCPKRCASSARATSRPRISTRRSRDGLGLRWSFMGPFATIELNAPGRRRRLLRALQRLLSHARRRSAVAGRVGRATSARVAAAARAAAPSRDEQRRAHALARRAPARAARSTSANNPIPTEDSAMAATAAKSSSPAPSPARSTRRRCRRTCRSRRRRSPTRRSAPREAGAAIVHLHARDPVDGQSDAGSRSTSASSRPRSRGARTS